MFKRFFFLILAVLLLACFVSAAIADSETGRNEYYVYTENGKDLNVRSDPKGEIVGTLKYGTKVTVISMINANWAMIHFTYEKPDLGAGEWQAYVNRRYLISVAPEELQKAMEKEKTEYTGDPLEDINTEFANAADVDNYRITVRPARVTSWVNMRWIPSETGMIIAQYKATEELIVLKELEDYLQVQDPDTGDVGYIHKKFAAREQ